jgi:DNA ligase 1
MTFAELVAVSDRVAAASGRLEKTEQLASLLRRLAPDEVEAAVAFLSGMPRQGRIGLGWSAVAPARDTGAAESASLTVGDVDRAFERIAGVGGRGAAAERGRLLQTLYESATAAERDFLTRLIFGELRQGALEGVLADAVARAAEVSPADLRRAAMLAGDLGHVSAAALTRGRAGLAGFSVTLLQPVQPMLAESAGDVAEALGRLGSAALEYKLDGARIQVHKAGGDVRVFSRNLRDVTAAVPEVVLAVQALPAREAILDGEVIGFRPDGFPQPFQVTMRRFGRKLDVERLRQEIPVQPFFFDILQHDGASVIDEPQSRRFDRLRDLAPAALVVPHLSTGRVEEAEAFVREALARGHEGVMAKAPAAPYAAGSRGQAWLKVKQVRTLDLVVLAAEWGHGRRRGWLSNLHLGARDEASGGFVMLGKTFKGLTDEMLAWQTEALLRLEVARDEYTVWVRPELVVEIAFNDLQDSPRYPGGLALRFARVRRYRTDKPAAAADTLATVRALHGG